MMLAKLADATAASVLEGFTAKLRSISEPMRQTLTYDEDKLMALHAEFSANTGIKVYFCDPHSLWPRGCCENINGSYDSNFVCGQGKNGIHTTYATEPSISINLYQK
jgi:IS30 family transposase